MATIITSDCINCGACEPECPNTAIYAGGVPWELGGAIESGDRAGHLSISSRRSAPNASASTIMKHARRYARSIAASPTPTIPKPKACCSSARAQLHPELTFPDDAPSRFRKEGGEARRRLRPTAPQPRHRAAPAPAPKPAGSRSCAKPRRPSRRRHRQHRAEEFDPLTWAVPVICKDCNEPFTIPYRLFQAGVVFYCPNCSGSFVPKPEAMPQRARGFRGLLRAAPRASASARGKRERERTAAFEAQQAAETEAFKQKLRRWRIRRSRRARW